MNKKNDKNNNFVAFSGTTCTDLFELDAKFFDLIGGGVGGEDAGPVLR